MLWRRGNCWKKLYTLYLKAKENFQELGISTCFVSLGILKYRDADNSDLYLNEVKSITSFGVVATNTLEDSSYARNMNAYGLIGEGNNVENNSRVEDSNGYLVGEFFIDGPLWCPDYYIVSSRLVDFEKKIVDIAHSLQEAKRKMSEHMLLHIFSLYLNLIR